MRSAAIVALLVLVTLVGTAAPPVRGAATPSSAQRAAMQAIDEAAAGLSQLQAIHARTVQLNQRMSAMYQSLAKRIAKAGQLAASPGASLVQLKQAVEQMQELQQDFNLQYLALQEQMQNESREFSLVSNIMKTKHDTAKNSISNLR